MCWFWILGELLLSVLLLGIFVMGGFGFVGCVVLWYFDLGVFGVVCVLGCCDFEFFWLFDGDFFVWFVWGMFEDFFFYSLEMLFECSVLYFVVCIGCVKCRDYLCDMFEVMEWLFEVVYVVNCCYFVYVSLIVVCYDECLGDYYGEVKVWVEEVVCWSGLLCMIICLMVVFGYGVVIWKVLWRLLMVWVVLLLGDGMKWV